MREKERDREIESDSSGSTPPTHTFPPASFFIPPGAEGERLVLIFFVDRVAWRTSRCYGHHSSGRASVGPSLQGPPRQRKSIEIRTWGRALKAVPAKQENMEKMQSASFVSFVFETVQPFRQDVYLSVLFFFFLLYSSKCPLMIQDVFNQKKRRRNYFHCSV